MSGVVEQLFREWQSLQPLKPEDQRRLDEKFRLEFNYNSNHIEGNTLTYGQTKLLLIFDQTDGNHDMREFEEMKAHDVALRMVIQEAKDKERPLTEQFIRLLNETILVRPFWKDAQTPDGQHIRMEVKIGEYKSRPNHVRTATGEIFQYASETETPAMMQDLLEWYNKVSKEGLLTPVELAALLHYRFIRIHPFEDGNGRVARLLVNFVLFRHGYPMLIVQTKDKNNYLRMLNRCDVAVGLEPVQGANASLDKVRPFVDYLEKELIHSLEICIKAAKGESIEEEDDFEKKLSLLEKELMVKESMADSFSEEQVWNVLEFVFFPLGEKIIQTLEPLKKWFGHYMVSNLIFKSQAEENGLHLNVVKRNTNNTQLLDYIHNAKVLVFNLIMKFPKNRILGDISFTVEFKVSFDHNGYRINCFQDKKYFYGQYPNDTEINNLIKKYKEDSLSFLKQVVSQISE